MSYRKYRCVAKCPELDGEGEPHCTCENPSIAFKDNKCSECGVCPVGNVPIWKKIKYYRYYIVYSDGELHNDEVLLEYPLTNISEITQVAESLENSRNLRNTPTIVNFKLLETIDPCLQTRMT